VINTVDVEDIDDATSKAVNAGGRIVTEKERVEGVGWVAYLADPSGIVFGVIQGEQ
jgi:predicted enzyme related to lactoylglutathione lyase